MSPEGIAYDFSLPQNFSSQVNGSVISFYQDIIRRVDTNAILYDSTKTAISPAIYDKETLTKTISAGSIIYFGFIKWTRTVWDNSGNSAISREVGFYSYSQPTATLSIISPVASKQITFTTSYAQLQSIPVESFQYFLYDSTGLIQLQQSDLIYTERLQYTFDGLLDATSYKAQCIITNKYKQVVDTGKISFSVDYSQPNISITPTTTVNDALSAVEIGIGQAIQNIGTSTGTLSYINDYLVVGNTGVQLLDATSTISWNVNIPTDFTNTFNFDPNGFTSGKIIKYEDSIGNYMEIGYNSSINVSAWDSETLIDTEISLDLNKTYELTDDSSYFLNDMLGLGVFYLNLSGFLVNGIPLHLNSNVYAFGVLNSKVVICQSNIILDIIKPWWIN